MSKTRWTFAAGLVVGAVVSILAVGHLGPQATAQPPRADPPRYQISTWSHAGHDGGQGRTPHQPDYGAYLVDTATGEVFLVKKDGAPKSVGKPDRK